MRVTLTICFALFVSSNVVAQTPGVKWINYYRSIFGGSGVGQSILDAKKMPDSSFILVGNDSAYTYEKESYLKKDVQSRPFMLRVGKDGNILWHLNTDLVDPYNGTFTSVDVTSTGDIIVAGYGKNYPQPVKYFIAKYKSDGTKIWSKAYGGSTGTSKAYSIVQTSDAGYLVAGVTESNDGDVSGNHSTGATDAWLLKLDEGGDIQWKKCFGGSGNDTAYSVVQTPDNGFVVAGTSTSADGDLVGNYGASDAWVFKLDYSGNLTWQKNIGGSNYENFRSIVCNSDTSYTVTGFTSSSITNNGNYGNRDLWVAKIKDVTGDVLWSKNYGGSGDEQGLSIQKTIGNGYLVAGYTESTNGDVSFNNGLADGWLLKLDADGNLHWQKCVGSNKNEFAMAALYLSETDFALAGFAEPITPGNIYDKIDLFLSRLGNANTIKGLVFYDTNGNGIKNVGEGGFDGVIVNASGAENRAAVPNNGLFSIDVGLGTYTVTLQMNNNYHNVVPSSRNSTFSSYFNTDSLTFAIQPIPFQRDLVISMVPLTPARPGFNSSYKIVYKNVGTETIPNGVIVLAHDPRHLFLSSSRVVDYSNFTDTLKWNYTNLKPLDLASITVNMGVSPPPYFNNGDTLKLMAFIEPVAGDVTPKNDTAIVKQIVTGSYDPNDKIENNGGIIGSDYITEGRYLSYTIRFQNTGTDTAFNVIVRDTLDTKLDWSTFEIVSASHPYTVSITNQNKIEWTFANINLPDSNINEPLSHGYVSYRIKPKSTVVVGDVINNLASIYFDYNLPVATNNALTLVSDNFSVLPIRLLNFSGNLNNNIVQLRWETSHAGNFERFEVERSIDGRHYTKINSVLFHNSISKYTLQDDVSAVQSKLITYRLKLVDADGSFAYSRILPFAMNFVQDRFTIYPNPAMGEIFISLTTGRNESVRIRIADVSGKILIDHQKEIQKGTTVSPVDISNLKAGQYIIQIITAGEIKTSKFAVIN